MAKNNNLTDFLMDVADAIRAKKGTTAKINPQDFSSEIASISTGGGDMPVIGDGKTYLYIKIAAPGKMTVPLYFSQTVNYGVTIDWGDGSATQTLNGTRSRQITHTYADVGDYTISLNPSSGCILGLGHNDSSYCVIGDTGNNAIIYCNMLRAVEIGKNVTSIDKYTFQNCYSLANIVIPDSVTSIGNYAFYHCYSLQNIVIPDSVTSIGQYAFQNCYSLASIIIPQGVTNIGQFAFYYCYSLANIVIPDSVTSIGNQAFQYCYSLASIMIPDSVTSIGQYAFSGCRGMAFYDFRAAKSVPTLGTGVFSSIPSDCKIVVPDSLYDTWKSATNWSAHASKIIKTSEFNG